MAWKNKVFLVMILVFVIVTIYRNSFISHDVKKLIPRVKISQEPAAISPSVNLSPRKILSSEERISNLKKQCSDQSRSWAKLTNKEQEILGRHLIVNDKLKTIYCYIPKVACSNWKKVLTELDGTVIESLRKVHLFPFKYLSDYSKSEIKVRLQTYFKFIFVREPIERLISTFRSKFIQDYDKWGKQHLPPILRKLHPNKVIPYGYERPEKLTLTEFFSYLTKVSPLEMNEHWMPFEQLCQPCTIPYDFIGSFDSLQQDAQRVLKHLRVQDKIRFPVKQRRYMDESKNRTFSTILSQAPKQLLKKVLNVYSMDYRLFSFPASPSKN